MNDTPPATTAASAFLAETHAVENAAVELADIDLYTQDAALVDAVRREGGGWAHDDLAAFGRLVGSAAHLELGVLANRHPPELDTHDRFGRRIDLVRYHPAYHALMRTSIEHGLHASPWTEPREGAHVTRAARFYLHTQAEAGHLCPVTMTFASLPALRRAPALAAAWATRITARGYDPRNVPDAQKAAVTIGMAMTEKQGGSDVRANTTRAFPHPTGVVGPAEAYELVGHKFFVSAPMCDAFLVLAQEGAGLSCFLMPRWRPDGTKNPMQIVRLKRKMGNVSNASSETELRGALAWRVGEPGRGVATILEMVAMTRFDCTVGSAAGQRAAAAQALFHCAKRRAFGRHLAEQPLMRQVLADLALESEASLVLAMRLARALDRRSADPHEDALVRLGTAVGKYWVCKRTPQHACEAMECIGGSGVMEDGPMPRLFRESPVNSIWEGSGNVQCLDVLRAMRRTPAVVDAFVDELARARGGDARLDRWATALQADLRGAVATGDAEAAEAGARDLVDRMALAWQAALLVRHAPPAVSDAYCASRLAVTGTRNFGALPGGIDARAIVDRATPTM